MKLILASQGFTTEEIAKAVENLVRKPLENINIAIINEAYVAIPENNDKRWMIQELSLIEKYIGGTIDFINLRAYDKEQIRVRLQNADIMYIVGGKQFILPDLFKETGFDEILKEFAEEKVIMGTSAGANVLGRQIKSDEYWKIRYGITNIEIKNKQLGLINFNIVPHYKRKDHQKWDKNFLNDTLKNNPFPVYAVTDEQAVIFDGRRYYFVGGEVDCFGNIMKQEKSCGAIVIDNGKVLLIKHNLGHWDLPKGHVEEGETEIQTAIRELKEETNVDIEINEKYRYTTAYSPAEGIWKEVVYFMAKPINNNLIPQEEEVQMVEWVDLEEAIDKITFDNTREVLKSAIDDLEEMASK